MRHDRLYLLHIKESIQKIEVYTGGDANAIRSNELIHDAVLRKLQILSESTQRLSLESKARYPSIDWEGISGFRNRLVHSYLAIDVETIIQILENDLFALSQVVDEMLVDPP